MEKNLEFLIECMDDLSMEQQKVWKCISTEREAFLSPTSYS
jgi:hypothetical protein